MARNLVPGHAPNDDTGDGSPTPGGPGGPVDPAQERPQPDELASGFGAFDLEPPARLLRRTPREGDA